MLQFDSVSVESVKKWIIELRLFGGLLRLLLLVSEVNACEIFQYLSTDDKSSNTMMLRVQWIP